MVSSIYWSPFLHLCLDNLPALGHSGSCFEGTGNELSPFDRFDNRANKSGIDNRQYVTDLEQVTVFL